MDSQPKLLLCVEDDGDDIALIEETAIEADSSLQFVAKSNGREAMTFLYSQKEQNSLPCLILLDINMPVMSGIEMLDALKKDERLKKIPVVVLTTSPGKREKLVCDAYGIEMVTKPDRVKEFKRVLSHLLVRCL
jgi:CheY-like chemotaxis protein